MAESVKGSLSSDGCETSLQPGRHSLSVPANTMQETKSSGAWLSRIPRISSSTAWATLLASVAPELAGASPIKERAIGTGAALDGDSLNGGKIALIASGAALGVLAAGATAFAIYSRSKARSSNRGGVASSLPPLQSGMELQSPPRTVPPRRDRTAW
jgi:hypothetical protein